jgi:hypothetical protein
MRTERNFVTCCFSLVALLVCSLPLAAQDQVKHPVAFAVSPPLGELAQQPQTPQYGFHEANPVRRVPKRLAGQGQVVDPVEPITA